MMSETKETVTDLFATRTSGRVVSSEQKRIANGQGERIVCKDILKVSLTRSSYIFTRIVGIGQCNCSCAAHAKYWHGTVELLLEMKHCAKYEVSPRIFNALN